MDVKLQGVDGDGLGVLGNIKIDNDSTVESELDQVRLKGQVVVRRDHVGREELPASNVDRTRRRVGCSSVSAHVVSTIGAVSH